MAQGQVKEMRMQENSRNMGCLIESAVVSFLAFPLLGGDVELVDLGLD